MCVCQCVCLIKVLEKLEVEENEGIEIMCDNNSTIQLSKNPVFHDKSKHIDVIFHFIKDLVNYGVVEPSYCKSHDQIVDIMTKSLKLEQFKKLCGMLEVTGVTKLSYVQMH